MDNEVKDVQFKDPELMVPENALLEFAGEDKMRAQEWHEGGAKYAEAKAAEKTALQAEALAHLYEQAEKLPNHDGISEETIVEVLDTAHWLNNIVKGTTVLSVVPGKTAGWLVVNLGPPPVPFDRLYLTVWCGGPRYFGDCKHDNGCDCEHWWDIALHFDKVEGSRFPGGISHPIYRSHMPEGNPDKAIVALGRRILIGKGKTNDSN